MRNETERRKVRVLLALTAIILAVVSVGYLRVPAALGIGVYTVALELENASGLYENAEVRYRGVPVGTVQSIRPTAQGASASLRLRSGMPIPSKLTARVRSTSVIGEQYVDLVPLGSGGPHLAQGSAIHRNQTDLPVPTVDLMRNGTELLESLPQHELRTVVDELAVATSVGVASISGVLDSAYVLQEAMQDNLEPSTQLLADLERVLATQRSGRGDVRDVLGDLNSATKVIVTRKSTVRQILQDAPRDLDRTTVMLKSIEDDAAVLAANLATLGDILGFYAPVLEDVLTIYPAMTTAALSIAPISRMDDKVPEVNVAFKLNTNYPAPCYSGYAEANHQRSPHDLSPKAPPSASYCQLPHSDPRAARGARNMPCLLDPNKMAATARECGETFARVKPIASPRGGILSARLPLVAAPEAR